MNIIPETAGELWTAVGALASAALVWVAWKGLDSLHLTKQDMHERKAREHRIAAVSQTESFATEINARFDALLMRLKDSRIPTVIEDSTMAAFDGSEERVLGAARSWITSLGEDNFRDAISQLNRIEAWAMYFAPGVDLVDEDMVFQSCVMAYLSLIRWFFPLLVVLRAEPLSGKFPHTVALYEAWASGKLLARDG